MRRLKSSAPSSAEPAAPAPTDRWAGFSLALGLAGFLLSFTAPVPFIPTPCFVFPLGLAAFAAGWVARQRAQANNDSISRRRALWGMALGCAGWAIYLAVFAFTIGAIGALLAAWWRSQR